MIERSLASLSESLQFCHLRSHYTRPFVTRASSREARKRKSATAESSPPDTASPRIEEKKPPAEGGGGDPRCKNAGRAIFPFFRAAPQYGCLALAGEDPTPGEILLPRPCAYLVWPHVETPRHCRTPCHVCIGGHLMLLPFLTKTKEPPR